MNTVSLSSRRSFALQAITAGRIAAGIDKAKRALTVANISMAVAAMGALATVVAVAAESMPTACVAASVALISLFIAAKKGGEA